MGVVVQREENYFESHLDLRHHGHDHHHYRDVDFRGNCPVAENRLVDGDCDDGAAVVDFGGGGEKAAVVPCSTRNSPLATVHSRAAKLRFARLFRHFRP